MRNLKDECGMWKMNAECMECKRSVQNVWEMNKNEVKNRREMSE